MQMFSTCADAALESMTVCAEVPSSAEFVAQGRTYRDMHCFVEHSFNLAHDLLSSGRDGQWPQTSSSGQVQQSFPSDDRLLLLQSKTDEQDGDEIFCKHAGDGAYMALLRPAAFLQERVQTYSFVTFVGWRKPDLSGSPELWKVEKGLMKDLQSEQNIHLYVVIPLADGVNYVNVVVGRALTTGEGPLDLMGKSAWHGRAVRRASPVSYSWVRIHSGSFTGDLLRRTGVIHVARTLCVDFSTEMPKREEAGDTHPSFRAGDEPYARSEFRWRHALPRDEYYPAFPSSHAGCWQPPVGSKTYETSLSLEAPTSGAAAEEASEFMSRLPFAAQNTTPPDSAPIRCTSYLGHNAQEFYQQVFQTLARMTKLPLQWVAPSHARTPWHNLTGHGGESESDIAFMCGAMFSVGHFHAEGSDRDCVSVLVAPRRLRTTATEGVIRGDEAHTVLSLPAYQCLLVARRAAFDTDVLTTATPTELWGIFKDKTLAINELRSWSGCRALAAFLQESQPLSGAAAVDCETRLSSAFGKVVHTGSHTASLAALCSGDADVASLDSHVLDMAFEQDPALRQSVCIVRSGLERLWPAPPCVASRRLSPWVVSSVSLALLKLHLDPDGKAVLDKAGFAAFERVTPAPYRAMLDLLPSSLTRAAA